MDLVARCNLSQVYTQTTADPNSEGREMAASTLTRAAPSNAEQRAHETSPRKVVREGPRRRMSAADRLFEARLRWFLAVSRQA